MKRSPPASLEERVARLERMVGDIHAHLGLPAEAPPAASTVAPAATPQGNRHADAWAHRSEQWLGRVGLGLLFLGLVYLFNYSIGQGWITPVVRVAVGLAIASVLLIAGMSLQKERRSYSQLLLAGSLAVYYVTGFAANQLYGLVGHGVTFAYMAAVMLLAVVLARHQDRPSLASLGALGGFATPLLLHRASAAVIELAIYGALVVGWTGVLYWMRGWPSLLWTYAIGGLAALGIAAGHARGGERWLVEAALLLVWAFAAVLPFARGVLKSDRKGQRLWGVIPFSIQLRVLGVGVTFAVLAITSRMLALGQETTGALFLLAAMVFAGIAWLGTRTPNRLARAAAPVAATLLATSTFLILQNDTARVAVLALEALLFVYGGNRHRFAGLDWVGHTLFAGLLVTMAGESYFPPHVPFDPLAFAQLLQIALMLAASMLVATRPIVWTYRLAAHALILLWLAKELGPFATGTGMVTVAWGAYGALLLLLALRGRRPGAGLANLQMVAFSALALAVLKLLVVDLGRMAMLWRVLIFMGFGVAFLALSSLFKPREPSSP